MKFFKAQVLLSNTNVIDKIYDCIDPFKFNTTMSLCQGDYDDDDDDDDDDDEEEEEGGGGGW